MNTHTTNLSGHIDQARIEAIAAKVERELSRTTAAGRAEAWQLTLTSLNLGMARAAYAAELDPRLLSIEEDEIRLDAIAYTLTDPRELDRIAELYIAGLGIDQLADEIIASAWEGTPAEKIDGTESILEALLRHHLLELEASTLKARARTAEARAAELLGGIERRTEATSEVAPF